jgi:pimeloyl-ACP methyl ester carboxylesterase
MATRAYDRCYYPEGVARQMEAAIADGSRVERLRQINVPTLVIHGADDPLLLPACGEDTARHIPGAEFQLVPGMGHNIPDELAPDLAQRVLEFIVRH